MGGKTFGRLMCGVGLVSPQKIRQSQKTPPSPTAGKTEVRGTGGTFFISPSQKKHQSQNSRRHRRRAKPKNDIVVVSTHSTRRLGSRPAPPPYFRPTVRSGMYVKLFPTLGGAKKLLPVLLVAAGAVGKPDQLCIDGGSGAASGHHLVSKCHFLKIINTHFPLYGFVPSLTRTLRMIFLQMTTPTRATARHTRCPSGTDFQRRLPTSLVRRGRASDMSPTQPCGSASAGSTLFRNHLTAHLLERVKDIPSSLLRIR
jgi:hypothetical protein